MKTFRVFISFVLAFNPILFYVPSLHSIQARESVFSGDAKFNNDVIFAGTTDDTNEITVKVIDPTEDYTVYIPTGSGNFVINTGTQSFSGHNTFNGVNFNTFVSTTSGQIEALHISTAVLTLTASNTNYVKINPESTQAGGFNTEFGSATQVRVHRSAGDGDLSLFVSSGTFNAFDVGGTSSTFRVPVYFNPGFYMPDGTFISSGSFSNLWLVNGSDIYNANSGNVGIGTANPSTKLDIFGSNNERVYVNMVSNVADLGVRAGASQPQVDLIASASAGRSGLVSGSTHAVFLGGSNGIPAVLVSTNGRVGIVVEDTQPIGLFQVGAGSFTVLSGGNVGIGTSGPIKLMHVYNTAADHSAIIESTDGGGYGLIISAANDPLRVGSNGNYTGDLMIVDGSGNVGIGTTSPGAKLDLRGANTERLSVFANANILDLSARATENGPQLDLYLASSNGASGILATSTHPVILGGSFSNPLILLSTQTRVGIAAPDRLPVGLFQVGAGSFTVLSGGNVGIGTTAPENLLHLVSEKSSGQSQIQDNYFTGSGGYPAIDLRKARGSKSSPTILVQGDTFGAINFKGYDGSTFQTGASILSGTDGIVGSADMPGNLTFRTTPDGSSSSVERMRISNGGNVGIGTSSPNHKLEVSGNISMVDGSGNALAVRGSTSNYSIQYVNDGSRFPIRFVGDADSGTNRWFEFGHYELNQSSNTWNPKVLINSYNGSVGIGTVSPSEELVVQDTTGAGYLQMILQGQTGNPAGLKLAPGTGDSWEIQAVNTGGSPSNSLIFYNRSDTSYRMVIDDNGNVGIGTTNPASLLTVGSGTYGASTLAGINVSVGGNSYITVSDQTRHTFMGADSSGYGMVGTLSSDPFVIRVGNSEKVRFDTSGNVGIGTNSPTHTLHVKSGTAQEGVIVDAATYPECRFDRSGTTYGYLGIAGSAGGYATGTLANSAIFRSENDMHLITAGGTLVQTLTSGGNVGIGTTAPKGNVEILSNSSDGTKEYITNYYSGASNRSELLFQRGRGTAASSSTLTSGDTIGQVSFDGFDGATYLRGAAIQANASGTVGTNQMGTELRFYTNANTFFAAQNMTLGPTGGLQMGSPTGGDKGSGTINVAADIYKNNSAYTNPDYALEHYFTGDIVKFKDNPGAATYTGLLTLDEHESYTRKHFRLPGLDGEPAGMFKRGDVLLEKLEEAYLYIYQLSERIKKLEARNE